ncbi:hypothetical protein E1B28_005965 [Marasmius oreades]|uniref:Protein CPL1-like domain-containing protein n=1 Tax=Marasmius oreades TaxID=181124 RepID=A0A9P7S6M5_9AGAR|nr:uncharacterized protein E1B28_005965 [Marasmius oreades]KAG7095188.1 hypothetical protein E1B28_005965 [Marasmius oreades]
MRLSISLVSTFLVILSSLAFLPTTVFGIHHRYAKKSQNAIVTARQHHLQPVTRDLIDLCINLRVVFDQLPLDLKSIIAGNVDVCLCLKDLDVFLNAKVEDLDVLGVLRLNIPVLRVFLDNLLRTSGKKCTLPPHAHFVCTNSDPCHVKCDPGFIRDGDQCVCSKPKKLCKGQCLASPNSCDPSATPRPLHSRRSEIVTLEEAQRYCGSMEVCGVPSAKSGNAFECIDTTSNTDSCGGCVYPNPWAVTSSGKDCTSPKALKVTCRASRCVVDLCQEGFEPNGPREACVPTSLKRHAFRRASVSVPTTIDLGHNNGVTTDLGSNFNGKLNEVGERPATSMMNPIGSMLAGDGSLSCLFSPPHIPDDPPSTLSGLLVLFGNISAIARTVGDFGELLGIECNCHNPAASHPSAPLLKSVVDLVLRVNINLNLLTNPADIDTVADLLNQILKASLRCLELSHLEYALRGILSQLEGQVYQLLKGIKLVPEGISNCDCETDLVSSLRTGSGLKKRSALRRGVACAEADETASFSLLKTKRSLISLDLTPLVPDGDGILDAGAILDHLNYFSEPGFGDTSAPVDIDLNCLGLNGVNDEVIADLGNGMNKPLNEVLAVLAPFVHPGELHPCIKPKPCNGSASGSESDSDSGSHGPPPSKTSSELGSSKGNPESSRLCPPGSTLKGDFTAPVDVDLSCLGLNGVNGEAIVNLGTGLNKPLNEVLDILSPMLHPANVHPCIKPTPCYGGGGSASEPKSSPGTPSIPGTPSGGTLPPQSEGEHRPGSGSGCSSASLLTSVPTASPPTGGSASDSTSPPTGSSGSDPESSGELSIPCSLTTTNILDKLQDHVLPMMIQPLQWILTLIA